MSTCYEYKFLGPGKNSPEKRSGITGLVVGKTVRSLRNVGRKNGHIGTCLKLNDAENSLEALIFSHRKLESVMVVRRLSIHVETCRLMSREQS